VRAVLGAVPSLKNIDTDVMEYLTIFIAEADGLNATSLSENVCPFFESAGGLDEKAAAAAAMQLYNGLLAAKLITVKAPNAPSSLRGMQECGLTPALGLWHGVLLHLPSG
jgi:hypothetical protein